ncbi:LysR substrate-binding domain-containing protein [Rhizobium sp. YIM 134829]|uniref:LysR substrate-binding domain-containing protein n=1 Tax=Rhizobium sp. YIM 134829 TaxID=3390453 RepID=UPI00397B0443
MLDLVHLKNFVTVARTGSISQAAMQVGRTQSALSTQMQRLAVEVGHELLQRTGTGVRLTSAGERLLAHAEGLLARHDDILADLGGVALKGTVSLGCPEDYSIAFLPELLKGFCATYPKVEFRMVCAPTTELRPLLQRRQIDMALVSRSDPDHGAVLRREEFVWVASSPDPGLLADDVITLALSAPTSLDHRAACEAMESCDRRYRIAFASSSLAGLIAIARSGQAISVLIRTAVPRDLHILANGLPTLPTIGIALEFADTQPPLTVKLLADHIRSVLPSLV